jgi:two-component system, sensor histidine kinase and response regulator
MPQNETFSQSIAEGVLDQGTLKQLLDLDDGELGLIQEMCQLFVEDMPPRMAAMEVAIQAGKSEEMGDVAHAVKGAASTMGAPRVRNVALAMETLGRTGKGDEKAEVLLERLKVEYERAQAALKAFIISKGGQA